MTHHLKLWMVLKRSRRNTIFEEVTQEHNIQEQVAKYNEEHAARVAEHQELLKQYQRRKLKKGQDGAPANPDEHCERTCESPVRKERVAVMKRNIGAMGKPSDSTAAVTPRRSPRVAGGTIAPSNSQQSPSPGKSRAPKCSRATDKTYAPEPSDEDALDDDFADFQVIDDKVKGKKRQRVDGLPRGAAEKKMVQTKKPTAMKKMQVRKKKSGTSDMPVKNRFQQTVRCSLGEVQAAAKLLKDAHKAKVREAGFGCVFNWVLEGNITRVLMCFLMMHIDPYTMKIQCGSGKVIDVNREAVHQIFGFPIGGDTAPRPADLGHDESLRILKEELGFDSNASIETKDLRKLLEVLVEDPEKVDLVVKVFFAILFNKLICPGSAVRLGREAPMLVNMDYKKMATMDFC